MVFAFTVTVVIAEGMVITFVALVRLRARAASTGIVTFIAPFRAVFNLVPSIVAFARPRIFRRIVYTLIAIVISWAITAVFTARVANTTPSFAVHTRPERITYAASVILITMSVTNTFVTFCIRWARAIYTTVTKVIKATSITSTDISRTISEEVPVVFAEA
jgi:hypothetical protein